MLSVKAFPGIAIRCQPVFGYGPFISFELNKIVLMTKKTMMTTVS